MEPAICMRGLRRTFPGGVALESLDLEAQHGEVLVLLGPNGAGKTTTIRLLCGVLRPHGGDCGVLGLDPTTDGDAVRRRTGVLTENAGLDGRLTARENLEFAARIRGIDRRAARLCVGELLDRFGMSGRADHRTQGFSTGERKRVALARALLGDPPLLFLDEPTSGLDPAASRDVGDLISSLAADHGRTIVVCTHLLAEAGRLADRMAVLHDGRLEAFGAPEELAAELWPGLEADLDLGDVADPTLVATLDALPGVQEARATATGATVRVDDRDVLPGVVATVVGLGVPVYGAVGRPPTLEDVYFAIDARANVTARVLVDAG